MRTFTVVWHYVTNYGVVQVAAENAEAALKQFLIAYDAEEFRQKGRVLVFDGKPAVDARPTHERSGKYHDHISAEKTL